MCEDNRIIQSLWVGPRLSTMERLSIRSFLANGHEFHLYCYAPIAGIPEGAIVKDAREIVPESDVEKFPKLANFSDWFRYNLIYKKGGWWVDLDMVCLKPFDFEQEYVHLCNPFKAPAHDPVMEWCISECRKKDWQRLAWADIGPKLVNEAAKYFPQILFGEGDTFHPISWENWKSVLYPIPPRIPESSYAIHLCHEMWSLARQDFDDSYPPTCLYESLKKKYLSPHILFAVVTCQKFAARRKALEDTWVTLARAAGYDVEFFDGERLNVSDDYLSLSAKSKAIFQWAAEHHYDGMLKVDDDCFIRVQSFTPPKSDYAGIRIDPNDCGLAREHIPDFPAGTWKYNYASGGCYWLSRKAIKILAETPLNGDWAEDRWAGDTLGKAGIKFVEIPTREWNWGGQQSTIVHTQLPNVRAIYQLHAQNK